MKRAVVLLLAACGNGSGDGFPVEPGGPGGPNTPVDAASIDASGSDGGAQLAGRVCLAADIREPTVACSTTDAGGLTVTLGTKTATTAANGTFAIAKPSGSNLAWTIEDPDGAVVKSRIPFGTTTTLPAMTLADYFTLQGDNSVVVSTGSLVVHVVKGATSPAGANATVSPLSAGGIHYANNAEFNWPELASGTTNFGMIWIPNAEPGVNTVTVTPDQGDDADATGVVETGAITWLVVELP